MIAELPLKWVVSFNDETLPESTSEDTQIRYVEISDVNETEGITGAAEVAFGEAPSRARRVLRRGDVVVSTVRTYLRAVAAVGAEYDGAIASTGFAVLRARDVDERFLKYAVLDRAFMDQVVARSTGVSYPAINASDLVRIRIPAPARETQRAIADYLDRETAQIDAFIAKNEELIALLTERRAAVASRALDGGYPDVAVRHMVRLIQTGPFGSQLHAEDYMPGGQPLINPMHMVEGRAVPSHDVAISADKAYELRRHLLRKGDLVVARRGELGRSALITSKDHGYLCGTGSMLVRPNSARVVPRYLQLAIGSERSRATLREQSVGSTMDNLNAGALGALRVPLPSIGEQRTILEALDVANTKIEAALATAQRGIELGRERRAALISAAVTGKIDVGVAA